MAKTKKTDWAGIIIVLLLILTPLTAAADIRDILLKFRPYVTVQEEYNSNLNLTAGNRIDDFITTVNTGLKFSALKEQTYGIDLDFGAGFVYYAKNDKFNFFSPYPSLTAWYAMTPRLTFRVREYFSRSDEPRERDFAPGALPGQFLLGTQRQRSIYIRNVFEPSMDYQFGQEDRISINYRNNLYNTQNRFSEDSQENFIGSTLTHWFNIKNGVSLSYGFTKGDFERSPDFTAHSAIGRYTYRFSPRTSVFGEYNYAQHDFGSPSVGPSSSSSADYAVHTSSVGVTHAFSPTLSGGAQLGYFQQKPDEGPATSGLSYNLNLSRQAQKTTYTFFFQGGYTEDFFTAENRGFSKYHRLIGTVTHRLQERATIGGYSSFEQAKSGAGETDRIWGIGANGSYQLLKWMSLALDVSHRENRSDIADNDYSEYRAIFRVTASY